MQFSPLSLVKDRVTVGQPLPFNVRDADQTLMLARGQVIARLRDSAPRDIARDQQSRRR